MQDPERRPIDPEEGHDPEEQYELPEDISWADAPRIAASGFAMGSADVVPGVSGGTLAVACGIYEELLAAIASVDVQSIKDLFRLRFREILARVHFRFLLSLFGGILAAIVVMIKVIRLPELLQEHPTEVYAVFFGLVFASIFVLGRHVTWNFRHLVSFAAGTIFGWLVVNLVPVDTPSGPLMMFGYGTVAISAMLLPGISGSFILLILGQYETVIESLERLIHLDFSAVLVIVPFAIGCLFGLGAFSRFVAWLLTHFHNTVVAGLCGLLLGSLWRIWPYQTTTTELVRGKVKVIEAVPFWPDQLEVTVLLLAVAGFSAVFLVEYVASRKGG